MESLRLPLPSAATGFSATVEGWRDQGRIETEPSATSHPHHHAMKVKSTLISVVLTAFAANAYSATITPIDSFDPTTFFTGVTAGFDFNGAGGPNQAGFTAISPSGATTYNAVSNGITLDLTITGTNASAHRNRNNAAAGNLVTDFGQWYDNTGNQAGEAAFSFTGLTPNTDYEISFFVMNLGAGQMTHDFHEGTSSADPLITTFTTSGNQNDYSTWSPGITFGINSGPSGQIDVTMKEAGSRLNIDGVSLVPEPSSIALLGLGGLALFRRSRR
jgi:hypothetical protein